MVRSQSEAYEVENLELLAYCVTAWPERGGLEVLFNRAYQPIWQRMPGQAAEPADPAQRIARWRNRWFYDECPEPRRAAPRYSLDTQAVLERVLAAFKAGDDVTPGRLPGWEACSAGQLLS